MTEVAQMSCSAFSHITPQQQYQQMDDDIASLKADMFAHPENTVIDQQDIALVQQDEALTREAMDNTNKINADLRAAGVNPDMNSASYQEVLSLGSRMNEINETLGINKELLKLHTDIAQAQTDMVQNPQNTTEDQSKISADIIEAVKISSIHDLYDEFQKTKDPKTAIKLDQDLLDFQRSIPHNAEGKIDPNNSLSGILIANRVDLASEEPGKLGSTPTDSLTRLMLRVGSDIDYKTPISSFGYAPIRG